MIKRNVQVILDIECYDDLDIEGQDWKELLDLQGDEDVHVSIRDIDPFYDDVPVRSLVQTEYTFSWDKLTSTR